MDEQDVMPDGLLRSDPSGSGLIRRRCGRGFRYLDAAGLAVSEPEVLARVEGLVIPPAWKDVWICVEPNGHIQAAGTDVAGRRQYRYHTLELRDQPVHRLVNSLLRRRGGGEDLLVYHNGSDWHDVRAEDLNAAVKEVLGHRYTAKDLRTWNATVLAAVLLARAVTDGVPTSERARKRTVSAAVKEVSAHLGNTPAVARSSYIDPRVVERFEEGRTILPALRRAGFPDPSDDGGRARVERSVVRLLREG